MNHQLEEYFYVNHENNDSVAQNNRSKRREVEDATPPLANQASTSSATPHVPIMNAQPRVVDQQKQSTRKKKPNERLANPSPILVLVIFRPPTKPTFPPLNIVEKMKKTNVSIPMWNVLSIPSQWELLQQELQTVEVQSVPLPMSGAVSLMQPTKDEGRSKKSKPSPFYLSLIIGDKIVHNCMIDSRASSSIMPRCVADQLGMKYEPMIKHVFN